jgi:glucosamine 6-phosphate synthetase-like amidotransferase/phosphosugar isomerase protein
MSGSQQKRHSDSVIDNRATKQARSDDQENQARSDDQENQAILYAEGTELQRMQLLVDTMKAENARLRTSYSVIKLNRKYSKSVFLHDLALGIKSKYPTTDDGTALRSAQGVLTSLRAAVNISLANIAVEVKQKSWKAAVPRIKDALVAEVRAKLILPMKEIDKDDAIEWVCSSSWEYARGNRNRRSRVAANIESNG